MIKEVYTLNGGSTIMTHSKIKNKVCMKEKTFFRKAYSLWSSYQIIHIA